MSIQKRYLSQGSSPHSRGTLCNNHFVIPTIRIIPAFAGNTERITTPCEADWDHPRIRGEHHTRHRYHMPVRRIIPAFAGNTLSLTKSLTLTRDHPRIRGEHRACMIGIADKPGSSPHSRGTLVNPSNHFQVVGIIPAFAGNTVNIRAPSFTPWDHPRIRGEHLSQQSREICTSGSSPHSRGTPAFIALSARSGGIIPAFAGNTESLLYPWPRNWDHPRIRGEHSSVS